MIGKVVVSVASVLLVVGIAIGVVTVVNHNKEASLTPQMKAVQSICQPASDQASCVKTLASVNSDDPKQLIKAFMVATQEAVKKAYNFTAEEATKANAGDPAKKAVLDYCKRVFDYALEDLESILDSMGNDLQNINNKFYDLKQWLTSVYVYQSDCLNDAADQKDLEKTMADGTSDAKTLTSNAIDIFDKIVEILAPYGLQFNVSSMTSGGAGGSRRLLQDTTGSFPSWMSGADRKLLAKAGRRGRRAGAGAKPTFTVAKDGSGQFTTVSQAVDACPEKNLGRCVIYIKAGIYREQVVIPKKKNNIFMYGDGARKTVITFNRSVKLSSGTTTSTSGTVQVESEGFMAKYIGFKNTAGPSGHQAVALRVNGDRAVIFNCRMDGYQDTLYVDSGRQFYRNCVISGTIDFIFGMSTTLIQNSLIVIRKGNNNQFNTVTADGNEKGPALHVGIVIQHCRIVPDKKLALVKLTTRSYLGRPWKAYSTTIIMNSEIGDVINPEGWMIWEGESFHKTCIYREYNNRGPGAMTAARPNWIKVVNNARQVEEYTAGSWLRPVEWIQGAGVPFQLGL